MMKYIITDKKEIASLKYDSTPAQINDTQFCIKVSEKDENFASFIKYTNKEIKEFKKNFSVIPESLIKKDLYADTSQIPYVVIKQDEGDYNTIPSHNFCGQYNLVTFEPEENTLFRVLSRSEIQFSSDLVWGNNEVYLTYYIWHPSNKSAPTPTSPITFKNIYDLYTYGNEHFSSTPNNDGLGVTTIKFNQPRGLVFYPKYKAPKKSANGKDKYFFAKLEVSVKDSAVFTGSFLSISFMELL
jgi:DNA-directed RNA polymerase subunit L